MHSEIFFFYLQNIPKYRKSFRKEDNPRQAYSIEKLFKYPKSYLTLFIPSRIYDA